MEWLFLENEKQFSELLELSSEKDISAVAVFKHSTRCSISSMAKQRLERTWDFSPKSVPIYYLDLIEHRLLSNQISEKFFVQHQSPQLLIIKNEKCIFNSSHQAIQVSDVKEIIEKINS